MNLPHWRNFWRKSLEKTPRWQMCDIPGNYSHLGLQRSAEACPSSDKMLYTVGSFFFCESYEKDESVLQTDFGRVMEPLRGEKKGFFGLVLLEKWISYLYQNE